MSRFTGWRNCGAMLVTACSLIACGIGGSGGGKRSEPAPPGSTLPQLPGAPVMVNNVATDGMNWINYRRRLAGMPEMARTSTVATAAQAHSDYQKSNDIVTHDEIGGKPGFTGVDLKARLTAAGYPWDNTAYAGEVISATSSNSGFYMAEELITAIYHRFVMFEPVFKEIGTGSATTKAGYTYFTANFAGKNGYGPGVGQGKIAVWPHDGQSLVPPNFFSDFETPDPISGSNEVGYPISVHADINMVVAVQAFTLRAHGAGADLPVKLLVHATDSETTASAAAIIPLSVLKAGTVYDVTFKGSAGGTAITKNWSFSTR
ncbi:MAG: CAP domain-containing protein [Telluria sp.]|nr:CAP domain-containing protein [Telluria sp.]